MLGELLVRHRIAAGMGQAELARRSGLSERALRDLERGATGRPRRHSVSALASALELTGPELSAFLAAAWPTPSGGPTAQPAAPPPRLDRIVGRDSELRSLVELVTFGRNRVISVTGPGGVGKTRLAAALVTELAHRSWDVRIVDVSALDDPSLVLQTVAEALGVGGSARLAPIDRLAAQLRGARAVIVVDGVERVIAAAPELSMLARRCTGLTLVVTSQRPLRVSGERLLRLEPLPLPEAMALFAVRAAGRFELDDTNRDPVAEICRRVDGLPLAIELAAARMRLLTPAELLARLDRPLALLADGGPDLPARQRSLHATISSSLEVVSEPAGALYDLLGVFAGGVGIDDLVSVADGLNLDALGELVDMGLVRVNAATGDTRYTLPDTVRDVARQRLAVSTAWDRAHRALAAHYLDRIRGPGIERRLVTGDAANVRLAIGWAAANEPALLDEPVVHGLFRYFEVAGRLAEGQTALDRVGACGRPKAWIHAGHLARLRGDFAAAALEAKRRGYAGDIDCGRTLFNLAETAVDAGRFGDGLDFAEQAMQRLIAGGHRRLAAFAATTAAVARLHMGEVGAAVEACGRATALLREEEHDDRRTPIMIDLRCSVAAHAAGDRARAAALLRQALPAGLVSPQRDREEVAYAIEMHADLMAARDEVAAARLLGTAQRLRHGSTRHITPAWELVTRRAGAACRERLGAIAFERHRRRGFALDPVGLRDLYAAIEGP